MCTLKVCFLFTFQGSVNGKTASIVLEKQFRRVIVTTLSAWRTTSTRAVLREVLWAWNGWTSQSIEKQNIFVTFQWHRLSAKPNSFGLAQTVPPCKRFCLTHVNSAKWWRSLYVNKLPTAAESIWACTSDGCSWFFSQVRLLVVTFDERCWTCLWGGN